MRAAFDLRRAFLRASLLVGFSVSAGAAAVQEQPATQRGFASDAKAVLEESARCYAGLSSYADTGRVITRFLDADGNLRHTTVKPFVTRFERDEPAGGARRYYFEFRDTAGPMREINEDASWKDFPIRYVVWRSSPDQVFKTWWTIQPEVEVHDDFMSAIAGPTGVSGGSALTIPAQLAPGQIDARRVLEMQSANLDGIEEHDGRQCHVVSGMYSDAGARIWIDVEQKVIRKLTLSIKFENFRSEETISYSPDLAPKFADSDFAFEPPK